MAKYTHANAAIETAIDDGGVYLDSPPEREGAFKLSNDFQSGGLWRND